LLGPLERVAGTVGSSKAGMAILERVEVVERTRDWNRALGSAFFAGIIVAELLWVAGIALLVIKLAG
jgi:hypothetical protein